MYLLVAVVTPVQFGCYDNHPSNEKAYLCDPDTDSCGPTATCVLAGAYYVCSNDSGCPGGCETNKACANGICQCFGSCDGKECGDDSCGKSCGNCPDGAPWECIAGTCVNDCEEAECGDSPHGLFCGTCQDGWWCDSGTCKDDCTGQECGNSPHDVSCGTCESGWWCDSGTCKDDCAGLKCGNSPHGFSCGTCSTNWGCDAGTCINLNACNPPTDPTRCIEDTTVVYFCSQDTSTWAPYVCAEVCAANGMIGDQCTTTADGDNCDCTYDCAQPALVTTQCTNLNYSPCTCAAADPCSWLGDDYCDANCLTLFPDNSFTDTADCTCEGACNPETFSGFCSEGNACDCVINTKTPTDCAAFCANLGGSVDPKGSCLISSNDGKARCACGDFVCDVPEHVTAQCAYGYTPCTCATADPCAWVADDYCDGLTCNELFPAQTNVDDSASAACIK